VAESIKERREKRLTRDLANWTVCAKFVDGWRHAYVIKVPRDKVPQATDAHRAPLLDWAKTKGHPVEGAEFGFHPVWESDGCKICNPQELTVPSKDVLDAITQQNLPDALARGLITQREVDRIWQNTEYLSAQTPLEVRIAITKMNDAGYTITPAEQALMGAVFDMRAALFRDESKFAHLVAGTETIVGELQKVNQLAAILDEQKRVMQRLEAGVELLRGEAHYRKLGFWQRLRARFTRQRPQQVEEDDAEEMIPDDSYDRMIGSHWDPKHPRKK
jgi:hypothetical protein